MGKKPSRKPQKKLPQSVFLEGDGYGRPDVSNGIILPTAPSSKVLTDPSSSTHDDGSYGHYNVQPRDSKIPNFPPYTAFIGNLAPTVTRDDITGLFAELGVRNIRILESDGRPKGFGYVEFPDANSLSKCLEFNGKMFEGRCLRVDVAAPQKNSQKNYGQGDTSNYEGSGSYSSQFNDSISDIDNWRKPSVAPSQDFAPSSRGMGPRMGNLVWSNSRDLEDVETFRSSPRLAPASPEAALPSKMPPPRDPPKTQPPRQRVDPFGGAVPRDENVVLRKKSSEHHPLSAETKSGNGTLNSRFDNSQEKIVEVEGSSL